MAASIDDLNQSLRDILKAMNAQPGGPSMGQYFKQGYMGGQKGGLGVSQAVGGMASKMGNAAGIGSSIAGPIGAVMGPVAAFGAEMAKLPWKIKEFAEGLHQANRQFAQYSGPMAAVFAQSDIQDMLRKMKQGDALASSAEGLSNARGRLLDQLAPIETQAQRFQNRLGESITNAMATFMEKSGFGEQLEEIGKQFNDFLFGEEEMKPDDWYGNLDAIAAEAEKQIQERVKPVRQAPRPGGDQPNWAWDRKPRGDF